MLAFKRKKLAVAKEHRIPDVAGLALWCQIGRKGQPVKNARSLFKRGLAEAIRAKSRPRGQSQQGAADQGNDGKDLKQLMKITHGFSLSGRAGYVCMECNHGRPANDKGPRKPEAFESSYANRQLTRAQFWLEHSSPPATHPRKRSASPLTSILPM